MKDLIEPTLCTIDFTRLLRDFHRLLDLYPMGVQNQLGFVHRPGAIYPLKDGIGSFWDFENNCPLVDESTFSVFNEELKNTYFYDIYRMFPAARRMRLMRLPSKACISMHFDLEYRYHIALVTNPNSYIIYKDENKYHIPADGVIYKMDARLRHTAFNAGKSDRYHLLIHDDIDNPQGIIEN